MKLNLSYPVTGLQKVIEIDDDNKLRAFYDKRMSHEVSGDHLGDDFKGYIFKISGGNDKQGFCMTQGVLTTGRVRLLMRDGMPGYRQRTTGERKRKSVRGCIVSSDLSVLNLVVVKKGDGEIEGLTDSVKPRHLGPKRASKIRKLFNLSKDDDVRQFVIRRQINRDGKKPRFKAPKIQRLVTPQRLQHKRARIAIKRERHTKTRSEAEAYNELLNKRHKEQQQAKQERISQRRSSRRQSEAAHPAAKTDAPAASKPVIAHAPASAASTVKPAPAKVSAPKVVKVKAAAADSTQTSSSAPPAGKTVKQAKAAQPKAAQPKAAQPKAAQPKPAKATK